MEVTGLGQFKERTTEGQINSRQKFQHSRGSRAAKKSGIELDQSWEIVKVRMLMCEALH